MNVVPAAPFQAADPPTCPYCHLRFSSRNELLDHMNREHPDRGGRKGG